LTQSRSVPARYLTGLVGRDIQASLTPRLHESEADAQGVRLVYRLFDFAADGRTEADLPGLLDALQLVGFAGINVTHPYKQAVIAHLDELSPQAAQIGSVNTVIFREGRRIGYNTDVTGFAENLRSGLPHGTAIDRVVQMGAGGAGAATAHALMDLGVAQLTLFDSDPARANTLADALCAAHGADRAIVGQDLAASITHADGIVNATPMGMAVHPGSAVPRALLEPRLWVTDIVYFPLETQFLREARAAGCTALDGSGMTIYQAVGAFHHFTGLTADPARMRTNFHAALAG
jgi:shikimate dehydrogenase